MNVIYFNLLKLLDFGFIELKNCVLMGFMYMGLEDWFWNIYKFVCYFVEWVEGGVGLMVMGGYLLNFVGQLVLLVFIMNNWVMVFLYWYVIGVVYEVGGKICLQLLYVGCYGYQFLIVFVLVIKVLISLFKVWVLLSKGVEWQIDDFVSVVKLV